MIRGLVAGLLMAAGQMWAVSNTVLVHEAAGTAQASRPFTMLMVCVRGEFPFGTVPRPRVNGSFLSAWQVDVKSRWPDGSVLTAYVSFPVSLAANGSATVDFVPDTNTCHLGGQATCEAAALTQTGMLNFMGSDWNAQIRGTANSIVYMVDAKTMIGNGDWQYWLRGPVVTRVVVRKNGFDYDFGWQWDGSNWQTPSDDRFRSVHPMFELSFYPGWNGVETGFRVENSWWRKLQNLKLKLEFLAGSPAAPVYAKTNYDLEAKAASSYYAWSGAEPGAILVDRNLPYLVATRVFPAYDTRIQLASAQVSTYLGQWPANVGTDDANRPDPRSCTTQNPCAYIKTDMPGTGDHPNFGVVPRWQVAFLYAMGDSQFSVATRRDLFDRLIVGSGDAAVTIPIHYRESVTGMTPSYRNFLDAPDDPVTPSFGRIKSITAHPDGRFGQYDTSGPYPAQYVCSGCPARTHIWLPDMAHWPSLFSVPYVLTGRLTYLWSLQQSAAHWVGWENPVYGRHFGWGILYDSSNPRGPARALKELFWAYLLSPESPERSYFAKILRYNDAAYEGIFDVRDGTYRNQIIADCRGSDFVETVNSTWTGATVGGPNGQRKVFYLVGTNAFNGLRTVTAVRVNGVDRTFGVYGVDTGREWYWVAGGRLLIQAEGAQPLASSDTLALTGTLGTSATPWCAGMAFRRWLENPLPLIGIGSSSFVDQGGITGSSPWMVSYLGMHMGWARQSRALEIDGQPLFERSAAKLGLSYVNGVLHPRRPALYFGGYRMPLQDALGLITTWERFVQARNPPIALTAAITPASTSFTINCTDSTNTCVSMPGSAGAVWLINSEYIWTCGKATGSGTTTYTVCADGRGYWGTQATSHTTTAIVNAEWRTLGDLLVGHTYPNLWVNALATFDDVRGAYGSGLEAYQRAVSMGRGLEMRTTDQRYVLVPRALTGPTNVRAWRDGTSVRLLYNAPDLAACTLYLNHVPAQDVGGRVGRSHTFPNLGSGTYLVGVGCLAGAEFRQVTIP